MNLKKILPITGLLVVVVLMYFWMMPDKDWQGIKVTSGQIDSVKLPDGSRAILKGPAELGYPKTFDKKLRKVKMEGEIYFEIVKSEKPFLVLSEKGGL